MTKIIISIVLTFFSTFTFAIEVSGTKAKANSIQIKVNFILFN